VQADLKHNTNLLDWARSKHSTVDGLRQIFVWKSVV